MRTPVEAIKITIWARLVIGYMVIMVAVIFMGAYVTLKLNEFNGLTRGAAVDGTLIGDTENLIDTLLSQVSFERKFLISGDTDFYRKFEELRDIFIKDYQVHVAQMDTEEKGRLFTEIGQLFDRYVLMFKQQVDLHAAGQSGPSHIYSEEKDRIVDGISSRLRSIIQELRQERDKKIEMSKLISSQLLSVTTIAASCIIAIGLLISFLNTRHINRPIQLLQRKTKDIAAGNFIKIKEIDSPPEIAELANDFNKMSAQLKELDEMKSDFMSHVSHELRTPLTAIKEASSMLREGIYKDSPEKQDQLLSIVNGECERLISFVGRILDLSRLEAHMVDYQSEPAPLMPLIQNIVSKLAPIAQRKQITLELIPSPNLPEVTIDQARVAQVMENLLGNALKYTDSGGRVRVKTGTLKGDKRFIGVSVTDSGIGIPAENLPKIFDKFTQAQVEGGPAKGTGLGLSIAKHIIREHGGRIWVKSKPGEGSTFFFTLPASSR